MTTYSTSRHSRKSSRFFKSRECRLSRSLLYFLRLGGSSAHCIHRNAVKINNRSSTMPRLKRRVRRPARLDSPLTSTKERRRRCQATPTSGATEVGGRPAGASVNRQAGVQQAQPTGQPCQQQLHGNTVQVGGQPIQAAGIGCSQTGVLQAQPAVQHVQQQLQGSTARRGSGSFADWRPACPNCGIWM